MDYLNKLFIIILITTIAAIAKIEVIALFMY